MASTMKHANDDCRTLTYELNNLLALLQALEAKAQHHQILVSKHVPVNQDEMPLTRMQHRLDILREKMSPKSHSRAVSGFVWYLRQNEVKETLAALERDKLLINLALQIDSKGIEQALQSDIQDVHTFLRGLNHKIDDMAKMASQEIDRVKARDAAEDRKDILEWLSTPDENKSLRMKQERKGQSAPGSWLLQSPAFNEWTSGINRILHCFGEPGAGKSMMSSIVVEHFEVNHQDKPIASVFCDSSKASIFTEEDMLRSILRQLVNQQPELPDELQQVYSQRRDSEKHANPDTVEKALQEFLEQHDEVYVVIDGLDEFGEDSYSRNESINRILHSLGRYGARLMVTSVTGTVQLPEGLVQTTLEIKANNDDIKGYVQTLLQGRCSASAIIRSMMGQIIERIIDVAEGVFLHAKLLALEIHRLKRLSRDRIMKILEEPPKTLSERYEEALRRIGNSEDVLLMLGWLTRARRDLNTQELVDVLSIEEGQTDIDRVDDSVLHDLVQDCAGLAVFEDNGTVRLLHRTVREYLSESKVCANIEPKIAKACLTYLCYGNCAQKLDEDNKLADLERNYPLLQYAARYWGEHYKNTRPEDCAQIQPLMLEFAKKPHRAADVYMGAWLRRLTTQRALKFWKGNEDTEDETSLLGSSDARLHVKWSGAHYAIFFGCFGMLKFFAENGVNLEKVPSRSPPLLLLAAKLNRIQAAKYLIRKGLDVNALAKITGNSALYYAVESGSLEMVRLLINAGANVHTNADNRGMTPLHQACYYDRDDVVDLLWKHGAGSDINVGCDGDDGATPLAYVLDKGRERCRELLLFKHKVFTQENIVGISIPLENPEILKRLLDQDTDPNQQYGLGESALDVSLRLGDPAIIKTCLDKAGCPRLYWQVDDSKVTTHASEIWYNTLITLLSKQSKPYHTATCNDPLITKESHTKYLTFTIPPEPDFFPPTRLQFTITSHDSGFSPYPETWGAYRDSSTFFVARIYESDPSSNSGSDSTTGEFHKASKRRHIVRNVHASSVPRTHTVMWDVKDKTKDGWMEELKGGRTVTVIARVERGGKGKGKGWDGWENHVLGVKVELFHG